MAVPLTDLNGNQIGAIEIVRNISGNSGIEMDSTGVPDGIHGSSSINSLVRSRNEISNQALGGPGIFESLIPHECSHDGPGLHTDP